MPTPDLDERFRRWLKLTAEMHENANFTPNPSIAWVPVRKPLAQCTVALVTTAGVHLKSQPAHDLLDPHGDASFREIPGNTQARDIAVDHSHYDTTDANADPNCVFPIDRLRELVLMGLVGGVAPVHYGFMGFIPDGRLLRDTTAPIVAERLQSEGVDAAVLTPG
ncbi:MAG TPA: glycine/sarcosine/betaine reductase selenoprotein B family protein [Ktedonobacteraceae bacterium]|nr:glycine/sarcosine/betaine reductase selenoprotein B family protein [Ktedonobacteraceae bacterium]